jgi:serine/threonine-protein kinase RsbT
VTRSTVPIRAGEDVVRVRQEVRRFAIDAGLGLVDQTKIVTAASELARNTLDYGKGGHAIMEIVQNGARRGVRIVFEDQGPGIVDIELALERWLHQRKRHGTRAGGCSASMQRVRDRVDTWGRHQGHHRALEVAPWKPSPSVIRPTSPTRADASAA